MMGTDPPCGLQGVGCLPFPREAAFLGPEATWPRPPHHQINEQREPSGLFAGIRFLSLEKSVLALTSNRHRTVGSGGLLCVGNVVFVELQSEHDDLVPEPVGGHPEV